MMYKRIWFFSCVFTLLALVSASGDWAPGDTYKMHFPQLPNVNGWDVNATQPVVTWPTIGNVLRLAG